MIIQIRKLNISAFIASRIAFNKERSFSAFIIRIAIGAVALSVAVMILAVCLVSGFKHVVSQKVFDFWGHIHISRFQPNASPLTEELPFSANTALYRSLKANPEIASVDAYATKSAIIKAGEEIDGVIFKGVTAGYHWSHLKPFLLEGTVPEIRDSGYSNQVVISSYIAHELKVHVHDPVIIYFIQQGDALPRARKLFISGIYKTSIEDYDRTYIIGDLNLLRKLSNWTSDKIGGYEIFVRDYRQMNRISRREIDPSLPDNLVTTTIRDIYPNIFDWLNLQNMNLLIILIIMSVVAVINMVTALLILILERTNMIGILKSVGMKNWRIQEIFLLQATYIILAGLAIGNFLGIGLSLLQLKTGFFKLSEETYYMPVAPIRIIWWEIAAIHLGTILVCLVILVLPSYLIRRITPVQAIRFK